MARQERVVGIQSWCFRHFKTLPELMDQLKASGAAAIELCGVHANFSDPATAPAIVQQLKRAGIEIVAIGVEGMSGEEAKDRPRFEWCKAAGVRRMSISFKPELMEDGFRALKTVEKLAEQYDLQLGIHNHGGYDWLGNATILKYVFDHVGDRIGLYLDTAWAIDAKQDPIKMVEQFGGRLVGVHVKDFVYDRHRHESDVIVGRGILELPKFLAALDTANYQGPLVIEYEADETNPAPALRECVAALRAV